MNKRNGNNIWVKGGLILVVVLMSLGACLGIRSVVACRELGYFDLSWSPGERIAYTRADYFSPIPLWPFPPDDVYIIDENGSEEKANGDFVDTVNLGWLPDGRRLAFAGGRSSGCFIAVFDDDENSPTCVNDSTPMAAPAWSPDGTRLAFWSTELVLQIMTSDGANTKEYPYITGTIYNDLSWSPDGMFIAYVTNIFGNLEIYKVQSDGNSPKRLTDEFSDDWSPSWSPDGTRIAFLSRRGGYMGGPTPESKCGISSGCGYPKTYTMKSDGTDVKLLIDAPATDWRAKWSPDGSRIVLVSERDGNPEIYIVNPDGSGLVRLTDNRYEDSSPVWSPDGTRIAFTSKRNGFLNIYVINADGTGEIQLTRNPSNAPCLP
ncbi:MAG: PD40 domain-containing protein [Anaerolineales bacterium]|nr:PD40 domain-containing protein [Anaerolineales bacterium]